MGEAIADNRIFEDRAARAAEGTAAKAGAGRAKSVAGRAAKAGADRASRTTAGAPAKAVAGGAASAGADKAASSAAGAARAPQVASQRPPQRPSLLKDLLALLMKIGFIVLVFVLLFTLVFGIVRYGEPTMAPAIKDGDLVIFYRFADNGYQPRDVVALKMGGQTVLRRVVALEGDVVDITEDGLLINGALQQEPGIYQRTERFEEGVSFPLTVPEGQVFLLGDSREDTTDSRIYGAVKIDDTLGKTMTVIRRRSI